MNDVKVFKYKLFSSLCIPSALTMLYSIPTLGKIEIILTNTLSKNIRWSAANSYRENARNKIQRPQRT